MKSAIAVCVVAGQALGSESPGACPTGESDCRFVSTPHFVVPPFGGADPRS